MIRAAYLAAALSLPVICRAQAADLDGDWLLTLTEGQTIRTGVLTIEGPRSDLQGFVDGGPVPLRVNGQQINFEIDYRDGGGRLLLRRLSGRIGSGEMSGEIERPLDAPPGSWRAAPIAKPSSIPPEPQPVDLSGVWSRSSSGLDKVSFDYTPSAASRVDAYNYLDDPSLRCISPGLVRVSGWPYPLEIVQSKDRVTILYESFHEVRRIFIDGRDFPDDLPATAMGYSIGHWEGSTLVVVSRQLKAGYVDLAGQPLSENAWVEERMSLSADGRMMRSELTLHDPENYKRPITRHRAWTKTPETAILEYDCDPYPFFRGLDLEGKLDEYWNRMRQLQ